MRCCTKMSAARSRVGSATDTSVTSGKCADVGGKEPAATDTGKDGDLVEGISKETTNEPMNTNMQEEESRYAAECAPERVHSTEVPNAALASCVVLSPCDTPVVPCKRCGRPRSSWKRKLDFVPSMALTYGKKGLAAFKEGRISSPGCTPNYRSYPFRRRCRVGQSSPTKQPLYLREVCPVTPRLGTSANDLRGANCWDWFGSDRGICRAAHAAARRRHFRATAHDDRQSNW